MQLGIFRSSLRGSIRFGYVYVSLAEISYTTGVLGIASSWASNSLG